jgi:hypothetical protein
VGLTEPGVEFIARQVPAEPENRDVMREAVGEDEIPVLVREDGDLPRGDAEILAWLDHAYPERGESAQHRVKALDEAGCRHGSNAAAPEQRSISPPMRALNEPPIGARPAG